MKPNAVIAQARDLLYPQWKHERERLDRIDRWYRHDPEDIELPKRATTEARRLRELAKTPWLGLIVSVMSQATLVDGYRSPDQQDNSTAWRLWEANDLDARQVGIHRATYGYGYSYGLALPGLAADGTKSAQLRGVSPRDMFAVYADPEWDDWPMFAMRVKGGQPGGKLAVTIYDEEVAYRLTCDKSGGGWEYLDYAVHGAGVCPVVKYSNRMDLEGRTVGEVEPFIPLAARINKTDFDRLLAQHYQSWQVRYATGMAMPDDDEEAALTANQQKLKLRQDDILIAEDPDTKFGVLPATPLDGLIKAHDSDVETLAAVSQTPTNALTGQMINMSAEALAAARAQLDQKLGEGKTGLGKSHAQFLRLGARYAGDETAANDFMARVTWADTSIRSLSAAADALGKMADQLGVPQQALWSRIPGVTKSDVDEWIATSRRANAGQAVSALAAAATAARTNPMVAAMNTRLNGNSA